MNITELIMKELRAMGCNPTATTEKNGTMTIKVNAPSVKVVKN